MTDFDKTSPNSGNVWENDITSLRQNNEVLERILLAEGLFGIDGHYTEFSYNSAGDLETMTVKNAAAGTEGTCSIGYDSEGNVETIAWTINGETLTYTMTYSAGDLTKVELQIT